MKTRRTTWQVNDTGNAFRPKHRRMATTDANRHNRHRERQLLFQDMQAELRVTEGSRVDRGTPHTPNASLRRKLWMTRNNPDFDEGFDGTSYYLVECDTWKAMTGQTRADYVKDEKNWKWVV
jgi:hypothetical protein